MSLSFKIAKWTIIASGLLFILIAIFAMIMVGSAGHTPAIKGATILADILMLVHLLFSNLFQKFGKLTLVIISLLTISTMLWVLIKIIIEAINNYYKGETFLLIISILIPFVLFITTTTGLIKKAVRSNATDLSLSKP